MSEEIKLPESRKQLLLRASLPAKKRWTPWVVGFVVGIPVAIIIFSACLAGGPDVASALAASISALCAFVLLRVMVRQTELFRQQVELSRPGCQVFPFLQSLPGMVGGDSVFWIGNSREQMAVLCLIVPKPGSDLRVLFASIQFLGRRHNLLFELRADLLEFPTGENAILAHNWPAEGKAVAVTVPRSVFEKAVDEFKFTRERLRRVRVAVTSNLGIDLSRSVPLRRLETLPVLYFTARAPAPPQRPAPGA